MYETLPRAIHPERRESPFPVGGASVAQNPPVLLWAPEKGKQVRYAVRISQDQKFPKRETRFEEGFVWAFYNPHEKMDVGTWFWQYGVSKNGRAFRWSEVFTFQIKRTARVFETPMAPALLGQIPNAHPRLWVSGDALPALQKRVSKLPELKRFVEQAETFLETHLPPDDFPPEKGETDYEKWSYRKWASKALAGDISRSLQWLAPTYLMTGDARYGQEIVRRAVHVAGWNPEGFTDPSVSDFADGSCFRILGQAYDTCYDLFSEAERAQVRNAMVFRGRRFFERMSNNLEARIFHAHVWQHTLLEFAELAFALAGEVPEADDWVAYVYGIWLARVPLMGGEDGGWANGNNYFRTNIETLLSMPDLFERVAGVDLFAQPWYQNSIDFMMYTWPPEAMSDGFGDGAEKPDTVDHTRLAFAEALGQRFGNGYAQWYVDMARKGEDLQLSPMMTWYRLRNVGKRVRAKSPRDESQSKAFRDVGVVSMHTNLTHSDQDLMVGFRASPFGAFNHMHANQNSFHVAYGGERIFQNSGYYIAYNDEHFKGWYKHTRGHNTILVDGQGQLFGSEGYGWVSRFLDGTQMSYCLGDASRAYGDIGLIRFRRHLVLLRPDMLVLYDDLEADHPVQWEWLLHSARKIRMYSRLQRLVGRSRKAIAQVDMYASSPITLSVSDVFNPPALNWRGKKWHGRIPDELPKQWHATVGLAEKATTCRYLSVMQIQPVNDETHFHEIVALDGEPLKVGDWLIHAEMDVAQPASLIIKNQNNKVGLVADKQVLQLGKKTYRTGGAMSSMLVEAVGKEAQVQRSRDKWPTSR